MPKPKTTFSNYFHQYVKRRGFTPLEKPGSRNFSVLNVDIVDKRKNICFDPVTLRYFDESIHLVPNARTMIFDNLKYVFKHELTHLGMSKYEAHDAMKIFWTGLKRKANHKKIDLLIEQVALRGAVHKALREMRVTTITGKKTQERIIAVVANQSICIRIADGRFRKHVRTGFSDKNRDTLERTLQSKIKKFYPTFPEELTNRIATTVARRYQKLVQKAQRKK